MISATVCTSSDQGLLQSLNPAQVNATIPELPVTPPYDRQVDGIIYAPLGDAAVVFAVAIVATWLSVSAWTRRRDRIKLALRIFTGISWAATMVAVAMCVVLLVCQMETNRGRYTQARDLAHVTEAPFDALGRLHPDRPNPATILAEVNAYLAIRAALTKGVPEQALTFASWPVAHSPLGMQAVSAALDANANLALMRGNLPEALTLAQRALTANPSSPLPIAAVHAMQAHIVVAAIRHRRYGEAQRSLAEIPDEWNAALKQQLIARAAHDEAVEDLRIKPDGTIDAGEKALAHAQTIIERARLRLAQPSTALECDLGFILFGEALHAKYSGDLPRAIQLLEQQSTVMSDFPASEPLYNSAIAELARNEMRANHSEKAIELYERARARDPQRTTLFIDELSSAHMLRSVEVAQAGDLDEALREASLARSFAQNNLTDDNLAGIRVARGTRELSLGHWSDAAAELDFVKSNLRFGSRAAFLMTQMRGAQERVDRVNYLFHWDGRPQVIGEVPVASNADQVVDSYKYTQSDGQPVARMSAQDRSTVVFFYPGDPQRVVGTLSDSNRSGKLNLWLVNTSPDDYQGILDTDGDGLPDLQLIKEHGIVKQTPLSGRISICGVSALVAKKTFLIFNPDPYFEILQNREMVYSSPVIPHTQHPVWNYCKVRDYKYGNTIEIQLWDRNTVFPDSMLATWTWSSLPHSDVLTARNHTIVFRVDVTPTELPEGFAFRRPPERNDFLDPDTRVGDETVRQIMARADKQLVDEFAVYAAKAVVTDMVISLFVPDAGYLTKMIVRFGIRQLMP